MCVCVLIDTPCIYICIDSYTVCMCFIDAQFAEEDLASSLLYCITDQMAQTSYLVAQAHSLQNVVFYGSYLSAPTVIEQIKEKMAACSFFLKVCFT